MAEETSKDNNIKSTIDAVAGLVKAVPIYDDAIQPAAKQIGKTLEVATKAVNMALFPLRGLVWGYEQIEGWLTKRVSEKLMNLSEDDIITPSPQIAGPALEALRYVANDETLRELYASLLATAMNANTSNQAHPGYIEVLKNLVADEAILLQAFVNNGMYANITIRMVSDNGFNDIRRIHTHLHKGLLIQNVDLIPTYIDNLCRLGLLEQPHDLILMDEGSYEELIEDPNLIPLKRQVEDLARKLDYHRGIIRITDFGSQFVRNVIQLS